MNFTVPFQISLGIQQMKGLEPEPPKHSVSGIAMYQFNPSPQGPKIELVAVAAHGISLLKLLNQEQVAWIEQYLGELHEKALRDRRAGTNAVDRSVDI